jgi:hypothetical protein
MPKKGDLGPYQNFLRRCTHKAFSDGENLLILEKDRTVKIFANAMDADTFGDQNGEGITGLDPRCWIAGPPVYYENKAYFATYIRTQSVFTAVLEFPTLMEEYPGVFAEPEVD